jgi:hypothetical protein
VAHDRAFRSLELFLEQMRASPLPGDAAGDGEGDDVDGDEAER